MTDARAPEDRWMAQPHAGLVRLVQPLVRALSHLHPVKMDGYHHVPRGAALLVGNHGLLGYESPLFFERILSLCGRLPIGLADRWFFQVPGLRDLIVRLGGMYGSASNGLRELRNGRLVVCYPGGAREVLKHQRDKYRLLWEKSVGFVKLAIEAKVPIVPFAAAGVDDTFHIVTRLRGSGELLLGHGKYDLPLVWGARGPIPNAVPFWFRFAEPITVPEGASANDARVVRDVHEQVWSRTQALVDGLVGEWSDSTPRPSGKKAA